MNRKTLCALLVSMSLCGCGTMDNMNGARGPTRIYGGVRQDMREVAVGNRAAVLDIPASAIGDTVTLPVAVGRKLTETR